MSREEFKCYLDDVGISRNLSDGAYYCVVQIEINPGGDIKQAQAIQRKIEEAAEENRLRLSILKEEAK